MFTYDQYAVLFNFEVYAYVLFIGFKKKCQIYGRQDNQDLNGL